MSARGRLVAPLLGLLVGGALVHGGTDAAFTSTTTNPGSTWAAATVVLTDDDAGAALFPLGADLVPGSSATRCLEVSYAGTGAATVRMYASALTDTASLAQWITVDVDLGTGSTTGLDDCTGFVSGGPTQRWSGTLASLGRSWDAGILPWAAPASPHRVYKITCTLAAGTPDSQQGQTVEATFGWEARTA